MPINGMSEQRRLVRYAKIRLGVKEPSERGRDYPKAVDYFVCEEAEYRRVYPEKARELDIMFLSDDQEVVFPQYLKKYGLSGLLCKGDGTTAERWNDEVKEWETRDCLYEECPDYQESKCSRVASLMFSLPKVRCGFGGFQIDTSSRNSIININSAIADHPDPKKWGSIRKALRGGISMTPLVLRVVPQETQHEGKKRLIYVLKLDFAGSLDELADLAKQRTQPPPPAVLPPYDESRAPDDLFPASQIGEVAPDDPVTVEDEPAEVDPEVEERIKKGFAVLGFTAAKQTLYRQKHKDPAELLAVLHREANGKNGGGQGE